MQELPETTISERTHCLCGSNEHYTTIDPSCPFSSKALHTSHLKHEADDLRFRGSGCRRNMCEIAVVMKKNDTKAFEDRRDSAKHVKQSEKNKVELLTRLRQFQISLQVFTYKHRT